MQEIIRIVTGRDQENFWCRTGRIRPCSAGEAELPPLLLPVLREGNGEETAERQPGRLLPFEDRPLDVRGEKGEGGELSEAFRRSSFP